MQGKINRRKFLKRIGAGAAAIGVLDSCALRQRSGAQRTERPNILFVMTDQEPVGFQGCYGNPVIKTPARDAIASGGIKFTNHFCASFPCSPSRATMITGRYAHNHGVVVNDALLADTIPSMGGLFHAAGYETAWIGKSHMGGCPLRELKGRPFGGEYYLASAATNGLDFKPVRGGVGEDAPVDGFQHWVSGMRDYQDFLQASDLPANLKDPQYGNHNAAPSAGDDRHSHSMLCQESHPAHFYANKTIEFLDRMKDTDKPFCAVLSFFGPHHPVSAPKPWDTMYSLAEVELPPNFLASLHDKPVERGMFEHLTPFKNFMRPSWSEEQFKDYIRRYYGYISYLDRQLERVLEALEANDQENNTIVLFTSDHGDMAGQFGMIYKRPVTGADTLMKVPLMIRWPERIPPGQINSSPASNVDLLPTLLDLADLPIDEGIDGKSVKEVLLDRETICRQEVFTDVMNRGYMMRRGPWKFVLNAECNMSMARRDLDELYNMDDDPYEMVNLAYMDEHARRVADMKESIFAWLEETGHPFVETLRQVAAKDPSLERGAVAPSAVKITFLGARGMRIDYKWFCVGNPSRLTDARDVVKLHWVPEPENVFKTPWTTGEKRKVVWEGGQSTSPSPSQWSAGKEYPNSFEADLPEDLRPGRYAISLGMTDSNGPVCLATGHVGDLDVGEISVSLKEGKRQTRARTFNWERELRPLLKKNLT